MTARLRFIRNKDGSRHTPEMLGLSDYYVAKVVGLHYDIIAVSTGEVVSTEDAKSFHRLKKSLKQDFKALGVRFLDEVRGKYNSRRIK